MTELREAVIVDCVRTPFGRGHKEKGFLRNLRSDDMGVLVLQEIVKRTGVDPGEVEEVILGAVEQLGEQAHPGRNCLVLAHYPYEVAGLSVERACVTAMSSVHVAALSVMAGMGDIYVAGGIDSMTHISLPLVTPDTDFDELLKEGHLLVADHTRKYLREEEYFPGQVLCRANRARWEEEGSITLHERARDEVEEMVRTHQPTRIPESVRRELVKIMETEARRHGMRGLPPLR